MLTAKAELRSTTIFIEGFISLDDRPLSGVARW